MTELEDKIRDALGDPRWMLAGWPDPMPRIRRAARRRRAGLIAAGAVLLAAIVTPIALLPATAGQQGPASSHRPVRHIRHRHIPPWVKRLPGEIAYQCGEIFCLQRPDGTGWRTLAATSPEWDPAWSRDGARLAFRGYYGTAEGDYAIYVADLNGCHVRELTRAANGTNPSWAPTGHQIAFALGGINVINADGTGLRRLTSDQAGTGRDKYIDGSPAWSARNRIAFVRTAMGGSNGEIYVMKAGGSGVTELTHGGRDYEQPSWSPSGRWIAFVAVNGQPGTVIEVANANGSGMHPVSPPQWPSYNPVWTPSGMIAFLAYDVAGATSIYLVKPDGTDLRQLPTRLPGIQPLAQLTWGSATPPATGC